MAEKFKYFCEKTGRTCYSTLKQEDIDRLVRDYDSKSYEEWAIEFGERKSHIQYVAQTFGLHKYSGEEIRKRGKEVYMEKNGNKRYCYNIQQAADLLEVDVQTIRNCCDKGNLCNGWHLEWGDV